jgi:hypothetical protein
LGASLPSRAASASWKSPVDTPRRYKTGSSTSKLVVRRAQRGRIWEVKRTRSPVSARGPVTDLGSPYLDRADPGLDGTFRAMAVADDAGPAIGQPLVGHRGQEGFGLRLDRLGEQTACT